MSIKTHHVVIGLAVLAGGFFYVKSTIVNWKETISKLKALPTKISKLKIDRGIFKFNLNLTVFNNTPNAFNPNGGIATLKRVVISDNTNKPIGQVIVNRSSFRIPANGRFVIEDLQVEIPVFNAILNAPKYYAMTKEDIKTTVYIEVLGKEYII